MKVSVLLPVYNCKNYIQEAINSILNQTYRNFEFLLIDDGSTDGTSEILKENAKKDKRIRLIINKKNTGRVPSLNKAIKLAKGEYLARMDADDISKPRRFEKQVAFLDKHPEIGLLGTRGDIINTDGKIIGEISYPSKDEELRKMMVRRNPFIHPSMMYRKSVLKDSGLYDSRFSSAEDYELFARMLMTHKAANLPEKLVQYRWDMNQNEGFTIGKTQERRALWARWRMITKYGWPFWQIIFIAKPLVSFFVPMGVKKWILVMMKR